MQVFFNAVLDIFSMFLLIFGIVIGLMVAISGKQHEGTEKAIKPEQFAAAYSLCTYLLVLGLVWPIMQILNHIRG